MPFIDKAGEDDDLPAISERNAGLNRREEVALDAENDGSGTWRRWGAENVIHSRVHGDPHSPARDEYLKRH
jgi:hypothetical protein